MVVVWCNAAPEQAPTLARQLVEEGLAACVNLIPVRSVYRWNGAVHDEAEITLWIKVASEGVGRLRERLVDLHDYDVPEVLVVPVDVEASHAAYVQWVRGSR